MSKKKNLEKLTPGGGHEVAEPAVGYGLQSGATAILDGDDCCSNLSKPMVWKSYDRHILDLVLHKTTHIATSTILDS